MGEDGSARLGSEGFVLQGGSGGGTPRDAEVTVFVVTFLFLAEAIGLDRTRWHPRGV